MLSGGVIQSSTTVAQNGLLRYDPVKGMLFSEDTTSGTPRSAVLAASSNGLIGNGSSSVAIAPVNMAIDVVEANRVGWTARFHVVFTGSVGDSTSGVPATFTFDVFWSFGNVTIFTFTTPTIPFSSTYLCSLTGYLHCTTAGGSGVLGVELEGVRGVVGSTMAPFSSSGTATGISFPLAANLLFECGSDHTNPANQAGETFISVEILQ